MLSDINLNLYRIFYVCAKCKSFSEASNKLCVSQPAISKQIKNLENLLDTKLFFRDNHILKLTTDGKKLFEYVDKSYNYLLAGEKWIKENNNIESGTIVIGAPAHIASFYLLEYIEMFREEHPNVFIRIINGSTSELLKGLQEHKIDFVIDSSPIKVDNKNIVINPLVSFETCLITTFDNKNEEINFEKLLYIMPYKRSSIRKNLESELERYNIKLKVVLEVETTDLIIKSVKKGIGAGYVVKKAVQDELDNHELSEIKMPYTLPELELNLIYIEDYVTKLSMYFIQRYINK